MTSYPPTTSNPSPSQQLPRLYEVSNIPTYSQQTFASPSSAQPVSGSSFFPTSSPRLGQGYANGSSSAYPTQTQYSYPDQRYGPPVSQSDGYPPAQPSPSHSSHRSSSVISYPPQPQNNIPSSSPTGMYTRNLIGSLSASAFRLNDTTEHVGIWFILQDLSVRTEGWFRLKMNFVNVSDAANPHADQVSPSGPAPTNGAPHPPMVSRTAPVLASVFSKPFQVFSAKKFPGVIESTDLSRVFAAQGIKIPIRKDTGPSGGKAGGRRTSAEDDEADDED